MARSLRSKFENSRDRTATSGVTLVEMMVVVAIGGILISIAYPSYQRMVRTARKASAKMLLSGIYTAEQSYFFEELSYTTRFDAIGFAPEGKLDYNVGFEEDFAPPAWSPQGTPGCMFTCVNPVCSFPVTWRCNDSATWGLDGGSGTATATETTFRVEAHAHFREGATNEADSLFIDQTKRIFQIIPPN